MPEPLKVMWRVFRTFDPLNTVLIPNLTVLD